MAQIICCSCSKFKSSPLNELHLLATKSKALMDLYRSLVFKGCDKIDNSVLEYIKFHQTKSEEFCVVTVLGQNPACALENAGFEVRSFNSSIWNVT